jgi:glycosyltransferase involved in cell wall biosynthesis
MPRIAFNLSFIDSGPLTGPGYYAVQLFEHVIAKKLLHRKYDIIAYVQQSALFHFSPNTQEHLRPLPPFDDRLKRVLYEQLILPFVSKRDQNDLLFSPAFVSPVFGARRMVATICDMYYRVVPEATEPFQRKYWSVMIPVTGLLCDRIITISDNSKKDIEAYIPAARGKTISIPLASRLVASTASLVQAHHRPVVLMVANLTPNKNCGVVVKAVAQLQAKRREISFVHAGKDHLGLLRQSIADNQADAFVSSLGKVSDEELERLYRTCLAVVVPSLYEGFGMPAVEAQAMGAPLICSDRGALPEAGGDGALYFDPEDASALADRIEAVLDFTEAEREKMVSAGFSNVSQFSWEKTARETMAVFDELLAAA